MSHATTVTKTKTDQDFRSLLEYSEKLEKQVAVSNRKLRMAERLEHLAQQNLELGGTLLSCLEIAINEFEFDMGGIYLFDQISEDLTLIVENNFKNDFQTRIPEHHSENKKALIARFKMGLVLSAALPSEDLLLNKFLKPDATVKTVVICAIKNQNKLMGMLCLAQERPLVILRQELNSLIPIGSLLGLHVANFQLNNHFQEVLQRYNRLIDNSLSGIFIFQDQKILFANERFARIHGYSSEEILAIDPEKLEWPLDLQSARGQNIEIKKKESGELHYECKGITKNGHPVWLEMKAAFIQCHGKQAIMGNVVDITPQKQVEMQLSETTQWYRSLVGREKEGIFFVYPNGANTPVVPGDPTSLASPGIATPLREEITEKPHWMFEYFKREAIGEIDLLLYRELLNLSDASNLQIFQQRDPKAAIGLLQSAANSQKFEDFTYQFSHDSRALVEFLPYSVWFFDRNLKLIWANQAARQENGHYSRYKDFLDCSKYNRFCAANNGQEHPECATCAVTRVLQTGEVSESFQFTDENEFFLETIVPVLGQKKQVMGILALHQKIDAVKMTHDSHLLESVKEEKAIAILHSASDAIFAIDNSRLVVFINSAAAQLFELAGKPVRGLSLEAMMASAPVTLHEVFQFMQKRLTSQNRTEANAKLVIELPLRNQQRGSMEWSFSLAGVPDAQIIIAIGRDISLHKRMESELTLKNEFLENIIKFNPYGVEVFDMDGRLVQSNSAADLIYGFKNVAEYCIFDDLAFDEANVSERIREAFSGKIVTIGPLWYDTAKSGFEGIRHKKVCVRITFSPIRQENNAVIHVVAIHEDVTERKQIETELVASEKRFREVVETALDGIFRVDSSGLFSFANPMMVEIGGYPLEELIGMPLKQLVNQKSLPHLQKLFDATFNGEVTMKDELTITRKDGREVILEVSVVPIKKEKRISELQGICRDITERKQAEMALRESKERYSVLIEQSDDGVLLVQNDGCLLFVNDRLCQLAQYSREELLNHNLREFLNRNAQKTVLPFIKKMNRGEIQTEHFEFKLQRKDESIRCTEIYAKQIQVQGKSIIMIHVRDISERKKNEARIKILSTAVESSEDGVFVTDLSGKFIFANEALAQMAGYPVTELLELPIDDLYRASSVELLKNEIFPAVFVGKNWNGELEAVRKSTEIFPMLLTISPIIRDDGQQLGAVGISKDITQRKATEEELRKNYQFLEKIIDLNPYGVQILDAAGRSVRVNRAFEKMFAPLVTEPRSLNWPLRKNPEFQKLLNLALEGSEVSDTLIWINLKDLDEQINEDKLICMSVVLVPIVDEQQQVMNLVGLYEDITERETTRWELERHNRELTALYEAGQAMVSIREPEALIGSILRGAAQAAGTEFGTYFSYSKETNLFRLSTTIGFSEEHLQSVYQKFWGETIPENLTVYWFGARHNALTPTDMKKATEIMSPENVFKSALWVPLMYEERLLGFFNLFSKLPDAFNEGSIHLVTMFADQAAVALENLRLYSELSHFAEEMEHKIVERTHALAASEAKFRSIVENSPDLISIEDLESRTLFGNTTFFTKLGYPPEEAMEIGSLTLMHPDDYVKNKSLLDGLREGKVIRNLECRFLAKDGKLLYLLINAEKLKLGDKEIIQFMARDITQKKQLEIDLKKSEVHHRALIDNVRDGVYTLKNNRIIWCNEQLAEMFGYGPQELIGSYIGKLFADQAYFVNYDQELYYSLAEKGHYRNEFKGKRKNNEFFDLESSISLIEKNGDSDIEALVLVRDITEQKRMQEKLIQSERMAATGKLAASIAHEINNPLQGMMASLAAVKIRLKNSKVDPSGLEIVESGLKRISNIVKQLLSLHRPEKQEKDWINLNQVVEEVVSLMNSQLHLNKIEIKKNLSQSLPQIYASSQQLHQVLLNLILNAQDSIVDGGKIRINTRKKNGLVMIKISDTGKGIAREELSKIFEPFYSTKKKMGTGLGLSVVHGAIESHGGKIEVASEVNQGTTFTIYLPIKGSGDFKLENKN
jgi:two-component system sporulation sensor kinase A